MEDYCESCIRNTILEDISCDQCITGRMKVEINGFFAVMTCRQCGAAIVGVSFYAPCETDETKYYFTITSSKLDSKQIMIISRRFHLPALQVKEQIKLKAALNCGLYLDEAMEAVQKFTQNNILFLTTPSLRYSKYQQCQKRIPIQRLT